MNVGCAPNVFTLAKLLLTLFTFLMTTFQILFAHIKDLLGRSHSEPQLRYFDFCSIITVPVNLVLGLSESSVDPSGQVVTCTTCECEHSHRYH